MTENVPAIAGSVVRELTLPSGGHVVLRDPRELRAKDKRHVISNIDDPDKRMKSAVELIDGVICMLVEKWDLPYLPNAPLPRDVPNILGELTIPDYDKLTEAAGPAQEMLFPPRATPDDADKPGSPTEPASA